MDFVSHGLWGSIAFGRRATVRTMHMAGMKGFAKPIRAGRCQWTRDAETQAATTTRFRTCTRLYTATAKVKSQPTSGTSPSLTLPSNPTVFNQPKSC